MPEKDYSLGLLCSIFPFLKVEITERNTAQIHLSSWTIRGRIRLGLSSDDLELELMVRFSRIHLTSVKPFRGIESYGPFIPAAEDPLGNGYLDAEGNVTPRGWFELSRMIDDVRHVHWLAVERPNDVFALYAAAYTELALTSNNVRFGSLDVTSGNSVSRNLAKAVRKRYGFEALWSASLLKSLQNLVINHPFIFSGRWN